METKEKKVVKKVVKRSMKKIKKNTVKEDVFCELRFIREELPSNDKYQLSEAECKDVRKKLLKKISKQLKKENSFLVIGRLIIAYQSLGGKIEELPDDNNLNRAVNIYTCTSECFAGSGQDILEFLKELDCLTK